MSAESVFIDFYEHFHELLAADSELTGAAQLNVPGDNIQPSFDADETPTGNLVDYGWTSSSVDMKRRRGSGTFNLRVRSIKNKVHAQQVLARIRALADARTITRSGAGKVVVQKFRELPNTSDEVAIEDDSRHVVAASFDVRLVSTS